MHHAAVASFFLGPIQGFVRQSKHPLHALGCKIIPIARPRKQVLFQAAQIGDSYAYGHRPSAGEDGGGAFRDDDPYPFAGFKSFVPVYAGE
jgi:hypothetical protein